MYILFVYEVLKAVLLSFSQVQQLPSDIFRLPVHSSLVLNSSAVQIRGQLMPNIAFPEQFNSLSQLSPGRSRLFVEARTKSTIYLDAIDPCFNFYVCFRLSHQL